MSNRRPFDLPALTVAPRFARGVLRVDLRALPERSTWPTPSLRTPT